LALTPKDNEAFYREVDEELRRDQVRGMANRYGLAIGSAVVLLLAAIGGYLWWQNHTRTQAEVQAERFAAVLDDVEQGKMSSADPRLDQVAKDGNLGYRTQAELMKAGMAIEAGNDARALAIYRKIASDDDVPQLQRDAALIRQTAMEYDKLKPEDVVARLKPLAVQGNAWFGSAGEMVGVAYMRQGKSQLAAPIFEALAKDTKVPQSLRLRASEVASSLGVDLTPQTGAAKAATKEASR
jgi:hypothetical protein